MVCDSKDGESTIHVRIENETIWLPQQGMAELFQISRHSKTIYKEAKRQPEATHKKFLFVRREAERDVKKSY